MKHYVLVLMMSVTASTSTALGQGDWRLRPSSGAVSTARTEMQLAADPSRGLVVGFGGLRPYINVADTTLVWDGDTWSELPAQPGMIARIGAAVAYHPGLQRVVLFGGASPVASNALDETWTFDGARWQLLAIAGPPGRSHAAMAWDGSRLILFGGLRPQLSNDTWAFDGQTWTQLATAPSPPPRSHHAMAGGNGEILMCGGGYGGGYNDTWRWTGQAWEQVWPTVQPPPRHGANLVFDAERSRYLLSHGFGPNPYIPPTDTFAFTTDWQALPLTALPYPRRSAGAAWFARDRKVVMVGGELWGSSGAVAASDTWVFGEFASVTSYGSGCAAGAAAVPTLSPVAGSPVMGGTLTLETRCPAGGIGLFELGFSDQYWAGVPLPLSLAVLGAAPACQLWMSGDRIEVATGPVFQNSIAIPATPALQHVKFHAQSFHLAALDFATLSASNAVRCRIDRY
ncbi:MAG: hypothetical protein MUC36_04160 [Planctomycetes bacterium]|jgi:hypothetical protein|nr:hypothetical protein [Planctomycetota bacterium]